MLDVRREVAAAEEPAAGEAIYRERCASCHGARGEGVKEEYAHPLVGEKSVAQLARYITKSMPDDDPDACVGEDAAKVARYIHDAFYSPIAQARNRAARIDLSRLTVRQYRNAVADLVGTFRRSGSERGEPGLRGEYFDSRRPGEKRVIERVDAEVRFHFGADDPVPVGLGDQGFAARWEGSVSAPATGSYEFLVRTDQAVRLWINDLDEPLVDAWVKSGDDTDHRGTLFLLGGRAYPVRLEFTSRTQGVQNKVKEAPEPVKAFVELRWRPPGSVSDVVPARHLSTVRPAEVFVVATPFPPDDRSAGYERGVSVSKAWDEATTAAAIETAGFVATRIDELAQLRRTSGAERDEGLRRFCERFVERAFRRPLAETERQVFVERRLVGAPDEETAVKRVVILALKSPRFLYLDAGGETDSYAVASRLSFTLWDSLPDGELLEAAAAGRLVFRSEVASQAERMLDDPRTRSKLRRFLHQWLGLDRVASLAKDASRFPGFDAALAADLRTSLDLFLDDVIWSDGSDFRRLLLSEDLWVNGRLAAYYGFDLPADAPFRRLDGGTQRVGVLSHPYVMASFAYADASSPIHRGVFLARGVLGRALRPPPEAFAPFAPELHPDLTTRERVALQTEAQACQACHRTINGLGFTLERFDADGRYREEEKGRRVDPTGSYELPDGATRTFEDSRALAEFLAGSEQAHHAFVLQVFHHMVKQSAFAYGAETPGELLRTFVARGFSVRRLLAEVAVSAALPAGAGRARLRTASF